MVRTDWYEVLFCGFIAIWYCPGISVRRSFILFGFRSQTNVSTPSFRAKTDPLQMAFGLVMLASPGVGSERSVTDEAAMVTPSN